MSFDAGRPTQFNGGKAFRGFQPCSDLDISFPNDVLVVIARATVPQAYFLHAVSQTFDAPEWSWALGREASIR